MLDVSIQSFDSIRFDNDREAAMYMCVYVCTDENGVRAMFFPVAKQRAIQLKTDMTYAYTLCGHEYVANEDFDKVRCAFWVSSSSLLLDWCCCCCRCCCCRCRRRRRHYCCRFHRVVVVVVVALTLETETFCGLHQTLHSSSSTELPSREAE